MQTETNTVPPADSAAGHVLIDWVAAYRPDASARQAPIAPTWEPPKPAAPVAGPAAPAAPDSSAAAPATAKHIRWFDAHVAQTLAPLLKEPAAISDSSPPWPQVLDQLHGNIRELVAFVVVNVVKRGLELGMEAVRQGLQHIGDLASRAFHLLGR